MTNRTRILQHVVAAFSFVAFVVASGLTFVVLVPCHASAQTVPNRPTGNKTTVESTLHRAAKTGDLESLRSLLRSGANVDSVDASGETPMLAAAKAGRVEAMSVLVAAGANVNAHDHNGRTALIEAAEQGDAEAVNVLVKYGAELNYSARSGSALEVAERSGHAEVVAILRNAGARSSGHSAGDTVCVRPWRGDGFCGVVTSASRNNLELRVTEIVGCDHGCPAMVDCSAGKKVGGTGGVGEGSVVETRSWCLTHTGVQR